MKKAWVLMVAVALLLGMEVRNCEAQTIVEGGPRSFGPGDSILSDDLIVRHNSFSIPGMAIFTDPGLIFGNTTVTGVNSQVIFLDTGDIIFDLELIAGGSATFVGAGSIGRNMMVNGGNAIFWDAGSVIGDMMVTGGSASFYDVGNAGNVMVTGGSAFFGGGGVVDGKLTVENDGKVTIANKLLNGSLEAKNGGEIIFKDFRLVPLALTNPDVTVTNGGILTFKKTQATFDAAQYIDGYLNVLGDDDVNVYTGASYVTFKDDTTITNDLKVATSSTVVFHKDVTVDNVNIVDRGTAFFGDWGYTDGDTIIRGDLTVKGGILNENHGSNAYFRGKSATVLGDVTADHATIHFGGETLIYGNVTAKSSTPWSSIVGFGGNDDTATIQGDMLIGRGGIVEFYFVDGIVNGKVEVKDGGTLIARDGGWVDFNDDVTFNDGRLDVYWGWAKFFGVVSGDATVNVGTVPGLPGYTYPGWVNFYNDATIGNLSVVSNGTYYSEVEFNSTGLVTGQTHIKDYGIVYVWGSGADVTFAGGGSIAADGLLEVGDGGKATLRNFSPITNSISVTGNSTLTLDNTKVTFTGNETIDGDLNIINGGQVIFDAIGEITGDLNVNSNGRANFYGGGSIGGGTVAGGGKMTIFDEIVDGIANLRVEAGGEVIYKGLGGPAAAEVPIMDGGTLTLDNSEVTIAGPVNSTPNAWNQGKLQVINGSHATFEDILHVDDNLHLVLAGDSIVDGNTLKISNGATIDYYLFDEGGNFRTPLISFEVLDVDNLDNLSELTLNIFTVGEFIEPGTEVLLMEFGIDGDYLLPSDETFGVWEEYFAQNAPKITTESPALWWNLEIRRTGNGIQLFCHAVPEPTTWVMLMTAAAGMGILCRRKMKAVKK